MGRPTSPSTQPSDVELAFEQPATMATPTAAIMEDSDDGASTQPAAGLLEAVSSAVGAIGAFAAMLGVQLMCLTAARKSGS